MSDSRPVIQRKIECGLMNGAPRPSPETVFVLSYNDDNLRTFRGGVHWADRANSKWCYVVDVSQRFSSGELTIPARGDVFFFQVWFDAGWQVNDPEAIVRNNVVQGDQVVSGFLYDALWRRGRNYDSTDVQGAEEDVIRSVRPPLAIGSGLTLTALTVRFALDSRQANAAFEVANENHVGRIEAARVERLRRMVDGDESFLLLHLAQHPDDTGTVLQMLAQAKERNDQIRLGLLDRMLEHNFIQDADIGALRDSILGGSSTALPAGPSAMPRTALPPSPTAFPPPVAPPGYSVSTPSTASYIPSPPAGPAPRPPGPATQNEPQDRSGPIEEPEGPAPHNPAAAPDNVRGWRDIRNRGPQRGSS